MNMSSSNSESDDTGSCGSHSTGERRNYSYISKQTKEDQCSFRSWSSTYIAEEDWNQLDTRDILDLEKIADKIAESKTDRISRHIDEAEMRQYIPLSEADFEEIEKTDILLECTYELYLLPDLDAVPDVKRKTEAMIERLESQPHFYCPYEREETTEVHVSRWINKYTSNPEKELIGFTSKDPYEPKRYIAATEPRASTSDTNAVLGKRKRSRDEEDTVSVRKCSSESRLVCNSAYRPKKARRAR